VIEMKIKSIRYDDEQHLLILFHFTHPTLVFKMDEFISEFDELDCMQWRSYYDGDIELVIDFLATQIGSPASIQWMQNIEDLMAHLSKTDNEYSMITTKYMQAMCDATKEMLENYMENTK